MTLQVIGSSSEGNAYVLQNESEALLLEAGKPFKHVLAALGGNVRKVVGCLITHEHGDHASRIGEVLNYAIPVYATQGTIEGAQRYIKSDYKPKPLQKTGDSYARFKIGGFTVIPFATKHDANEPTGYYIHHKETGGVLFATDTYYLPCTFKGLSNILIECNYHPDILADRVASGAIPAALQERVRRSHLSYFTCIEALQANDLTAVNNIVLIHLSDGNADREMFKQGVERATGKTVHIANPGLSIQFNKTPF